MRILITVPELGLHYGGPSLSSTRSADHLSKLGIDTGIAYAHDGARELLPQEPGVTRFPIPHNRRPLQHLRSLVETARQFAPDLIYDFGVWTPENIASAWAARLLGIPWIMSPRGMLEPWALSSKGFKKKIAWYVYQRRLLMRASALIATSPEEQDNLQRLLPGIRTFLVPNGVDLPAAHVTRSVTAPRQVLYLSRLVPKKQPDALIRAWARVNPQGWRLVLAGPAATDYRESLQALIRRLNLGGTVELREEAYGEAKEKLLLESQLYVLPTLSENFGIAVAEALAYGLPVITTTETPWHALEQEGCGWIIKPTEDELVRALGQALAQPPTRLAEMGRRGHEHVQRYSWTRTGESLHAACVDVLGALR